MAVTYEKCPEAVSAIVRRVVNQHYPDLKEAGVTIACLFAASDSGPAVKWSGYAAAAKVRRTTLKDRVAGLMDAEIVIDESLWSEYEPARREALIDHELHHLVLLKYDDGRIKEDDHGRPRLKLKLHDWQLGGFAAIVERHGASAIEHECANAMRDKFGQLLFGFAGKIATA